MQNLHSKSSAPAETGGRASSPVNAEASGSALNRLQDIPAHRMFILLGVLLSLLPTLDLLRSLSSGVRGVLWVNVPFFAFQGFVPPGGALLIHACAIGLVVAVAWLATQKPPRAAHLSRRRLAVLIAMAAAGALLPLAGMLLYGIDKVPFRQNQAMAHGMSSGAQQEFAIQALVVLVTMLFLVIGRARLGHVEGGADLGVKTGRGDRAGSADAASTPEASRPGGKTERLRRIAFAQKLTIGAVLGNLVLTGSGMFIGMPPLIVTAITVSFMLIAVYRLTEALGVPVFSSVLAMIGMFVPIVSLIVLLVLNGLATTRLRDANIEVGLLGARAKAPL